MQLGASLLEASLLETASKRGSLLEASVFEPPSQRPSLPELTSSKQHYINYRGLAWFVLVSYLTASEQEINYFCKTAGTNILQA